MKHTLTIVGIVLLVLVFVWWVNTRVAEAPEGEIVGGDRDQNGCLIAAGYGFSENIGACVRQFELTPDIEEAARLAVESVGQGYALTVVSFNSYEEFGAYDITLERGVERTIEKVYLRGGIVVPPEVAEKEDLIRVTLPLSGTTVTSPVTVSGMARGTWFFEASFPLIVTDWDGRIIGEGYATAEGEWMTEDFVPFSGTVSYELPSDTPYRRGAIIFKKDNPSDLPEYDDALEIPVLFE